MRTLRRLHERPPRSNTVPRSGPAALASKAAAVGAALLAAVTLLPAGAAATATAQPATALADSGASTGSLAPGNGLGSTGVGPTDGFPSLDGALAAAGISRDAFAAQASLAARLSALEPALARDFAQAFAGVRIADGVGQIGVRGDCSGAPALCEFAARHGFGTFDPATFDPATVDSANIHPEAAARIDEAEPGGNLDPNAFAKVQLVGAAGSVGGNSHRADEPASPGPALATGPLALPTPLAGGVRIDSPNAPATCSLGVNGKFGGTPVNITAAHCSQNSNGNGKFVPGPAIDRVAPHAPFGEFRAELADADLDAAVIVGNQQYGHRLDNNRVTGGDGDEIRIDGVMDPVVGQTVCKTGYRSGYTCGVVTDELTLADSGLPQWDKRAVFNLCALPGDSGALVFSRTKALAIVTASNAFDYLNCATAETALAAQQSKPRAIGTRITEILARFPGLSVNTGVGVGVGTGAGAGVR